MPERECPKICKFAIAQSPNMKIYTETPAQGIIVKTVHACLT